MSASAAQRVKSIVDELMNTRISDLSERAQTQRRLADLGAAVQEVQSFADSIQRLLGSFEGGRRSPGRPARSAGPAPAPAERGASTRKNRRGHRGPGDFPAREFILNAVRDAGSAGLRPKDIVELVRVARPGHHVRPSALVSTILTRLKAKGEVRNRGGRWIAAA